MTTLTYNYYYYSEFNHDYSGIYSRQKSEVQGQSSRKISGFTKQTTADKSNLQMNQNVLNEQNINNNINCSLKEQYQFFAQNYLHLNPTKKKENNNIKFVSNINNNDIQIMNLKQELDFFIEVFQDDLNAKNLKIKFDEIKAQKIEIYTYRSLFHILFFTLIQNYIKHGEKKLSISFQKEDYNIQDFKDQYQDNLQAKSEVDIKNNNIKDTQLNEQQDKSTNNKINSIQNLPSLNKNANNDVKIKQTKLTCLKLLFKNYINKQTIRKNQNQDDQVDCKYIGIEICKKIMYRISPYQQLKVIEQDTKFGIEFTVFLDINQAPSYDNFKNALNIIENVKQNENNDNQQFQDQNRPSLYKLSHQKSQIRNNQDNVSQVGEIMSYDTVNENDGKININSINNTAQQLFQKCDTYQNEIDEKDLNFYDQQQLINQQIELEQQLSSHFNVEMQEDNIYDYKLKIKNGDKTNNDFGNYLGLNIVEQKEQFSKKNKQEQIQILQNNKYLMYSQKEGVKQINSTRNFGKYVDFKK
ncbi:hypothetical protein PPERSA_02968 [Pseudocohnilembus persalinus]|uniref:Uncharacterized protein n=1 Tax=Pseudocohnilembus persalinus TaxID=266149 RepID=A0A0V0QAC8_PSEPJ|nr:hypothetical protein PPERSA_02968 [Pseudocohnilembus persalinus]|eukprot:KRW99136.1 hypothetical protein PPERSA_02968 [Pseudocohnilembus persalinus]